MRARGRLERPLQVLRQHGADSASHAPERCAGEAGRPQGQARGVLLSAAVQPDRQQLSRTPSWASSRARPRTTCGAASRTGTRATTASSICRAPSSCSRARGWQIDPGILHAPGSLVTYEPQVAATCSRCFSRSSKAAPSIAGPARQGRAARQASRSRLPRRPARLGRERRPGIREAQSRVSDAGAAHSRRPSPQGFREQWVCYGTGWYSAKELTVLPRRTVTDQGQRRLRHHPDAGLRHVRSRCACRRRR